MNQFFPPFTGEYIKRRAVRSALAYCRNEAKKKVFQSFGAIALYGDLNGFQVFFFMTEDFLLLQAEAFSLRNP